MLWALLQNQVSNYVYWVIVISYTLVLHEIYYIYGYTKLKFLLSFIMPNQNHLLHQGFFSVKLNHHFICEQYMCYTYVYDKTITTDIHKSCDDYVTSCVLSEKYELHTNLVIS